MHVDLSRENGYLHFYEFAAILIEQCKEQRSVLVNQLSRYLDN